jgi:muramoyltetrapeptide carboxypeptidase LdcA involved in peptidoglycan recycling
LSFFLFILTRDSHYKDTHDFTLTDALKSGLGGLHIPVIYDTDIGHVPPQIQIINGAYGKVDFMSGNATIRQEMK